MTAGLSHSELLRRQAEFTDNDLARLVELHATEVAVADQAFRQIAGAAVQRRKTPPVLVVIGLRSPALGEGGRLGLVPSFDPAALAVPMVVRFPKPIGPTTEIREERARALRGEVAVMASLIDLTPTLIDALGLDPRMDLDGRSLFPGALAPARSLVTCTKRGVRGGTLFQGDSAVSIQFGPEETKFFRRTGVTAPFAPMDAPTADELAIRDDLRGWLSARGF